MTQNQITVAALAALLLGGLGLTFLAPAGLVSSSAVVIVCRDPDAGQHPGAQYGRVARPAFCFTVDDAGYADGGVLGSAACTAALVDAGAGSTDVFTDGCWILSCPDAGPLSRFCVADAGAAVASACVIPNCWVGADGGWDNNARVDCLALDADGGTYWRGCNVGSATQLTGTACIPSECVLPAGSGIDSL